jgi:hypothetical protein
MQKYDFLFVEYFLVKLYFWCPFMGWHNKILLHDKYHRSSLFSAAGAASSTSGGGILSVLWNAKTRADNPPMLACDWRVFFQ